MSSKNVLAIFFAFLLTFSFVAAALPTPDVYYSFNDGAGTYNTTFWQDLSGNNRHAVATTGFQANTTIRTPSGFRTFTQLPNTSSSATYMNITGLGDYNSIGQCFAYAFYYDPRQYNQTSGAAFIGRVQASNASPSTNFFISSAGNVSTAANFFNTGWGSTLRMGGGNSLGLITASAANNITNHVAVRVCDNVTTVFINGVSATNVSWSNPAVNYQGFVQQFRPLNTESQSQTAQFVPTLGYELRIWANESIGALTDADLLALTSDNVAYNNTVITNTFPKYTNIVRQRDFNTDTGTLIFQGTIDNAYTINVTVRHNVTGVTYTAQSQGINGTHGYYVNVTNVPVGCYNWTLSAYNATLNGTSYCVGDVIMWSGQSNTQMGGTTWNYSAVNYNITKQFPISIWDTGSQATGQFYFPDWFNASNSSIWMDAPFYATAREISIGQQVPVMVISTGISSALIVNFTNPLNNGYNSTQTVMMRNATIDGKYAFAVWMQGESDGGTNTGVYSNNLSVLQQQWTTLYDPEFTKLIIVPVGSYSSNNNSAGVCLPVAPQRNSVVSDLLMLSNTSSRFALGANIYDTANRYTSTSSCIHYTDIGNLFNGTGLQSGYPYALRMAQQIPYVVYGQGSIDNPQAQGFYLFNSTTIRVVFDRAITGRAFDNRTPNLNLIGGLDLWSNPFAGNFSANYPALNISNVTGTSIVNSNILEVRFNRNVTPFAYATYALYPASVYNQTVVVSSASSYPYGVADQVLWTAVEPWAVYECESAGNTYINGECFLYNLQDARDGVTNVTLVALSAFGLLALIVLVGAGFMLVRFAMDGDASMMIVLTIAFIGLALVILIGIWVVATVGGAINTII